MLKTLAEFPRLEEDWRRLAEQKGWPLLDYDWFFAAAKATCPPGELYVACFRGKNGEIAIAPLVKLPNGRGKHLEILGASLLSEPTGLLYSSELALRKLFDRLAWAGERLFLKRIPSGSGETAVLRGLHFRKFLVPREFQNRAPYLRLKGTWEEFEKGLSAKRRSDLRRARRRAEKLGAVEFRFHAPGPGEVLRELQVFAEVEEASWKSREGTPIRSKSALWKFFVEYSRSTAFRGLFRTGQLKIGGQVAAALLGVVYRGRFFLLRIGYDETFRRTSPGILLIHEAIRYSFLNGLSGFEFLGYDEPWMHVWRPQFRSYIFLRAEPLGPAGLWDFVRNAARKANSRFGWRRFL